MSTITFPAENELWSRITASKVLNIFGFNSQLYNSIGVNAGKELAEEEAFRAINHAIVWLPRGMLGQFIDDDMRAKQHIWLPKIAWALVEMLVEEPEVRLRALDSLLKALETEKYHEEAEFLVDMVDDMVEKQELLDDLRAMLGM